MLSVYKATKLFIMKNIHHYSEFEDLKLFDIDVNDKRCSHFYEK